MMPMVRTFLLLQQKLKEERDAKRVTLDTRHQHIFSTVATKLQMEETEVEDFILDGDQVSTAILASCVP